MCFFSHTNIFLSLGFLSFFSLIFEKKTSFVSWISLVQLKYIIPLFTGMASTMVALAALALNRRIALMNNYDKTYTYYKDSLAILSRRLEQLPVRSHKRDVLLGILVDRQENPKPVANKREWQNIEKKQMFLPTSNSFVEVESFIYQLENVLSFIMKEFQYSQKAYLRQAFGIMDARVVRYLYLYAVFSPQGKELATLLQKVGFIKTFSKNLIPESDSGFFWDDEYSVVVERYFLSGPNVDVFEVDGDNLYETLKLLDQNKQQNN